MREEFTANGEQSIALAAGNPYTKSKLTKNCVCDRNEDRSET